MSGVSTGSTPRSRSASSTARGIRPCATSCRIWSRKRCRTTFGRHLARPEARDARGLAVVARDLVDLGVDDGARDFDDQVLPGVADVDELGFHERLSVAREQSQSLVLHGFSRKSRSLTSRLRPSASLWPFDSLRSLRTFDVACHERARQGESNGAKGGSRTPIAFRLPDPKSGASASSATFALRPGAHRA